MTTSLMASELESGQPPERGSRRSRRLVAGVVVAIAALTASGLALLATQGHGSSTRSSAALDPNTFAYITSSAVMLRSGASSHVVARVQAGVMAQDLSWSRDGNYLAWVERDRSDAYTVWIADPRSTRLVHSSRGLGPALSPGHLIEPTGDSFVTLSATGRLFIFPAAAMLRLGDVTPISMPTDLPSLVGDHRGMAILAGSTDGIVVAQESANSSAYGGPVDFYLIDLHGHARRIRDDSGSDISPSSTRNLFPTFGAVDPSASVIAYSGGTHASSCVIEEDITVRRITDGTLIRAPKMPPLPQNHFWHVAGLSYGAGTELVAVLVDRSTPCGPDLRAPEVFELNPQGWLDLGQRGLAAEPGPEPGELAVIRSGVKNGVGDLVLIKDGRVQPIAPSVSAVAWVPKHGAGV